MRDRFRLLLPLLVTWLTLCDSKFVDPLVTDVLPSTRIVGTVSAFAKMCENTDHITDAVCELVDVDKTAYGELMKKDLESQVKAINAASEFYEKTSTVDSQNLDKRLQGFGMLIGLKEHEDKLKEQFINDAKTVIEKSISVSTKILDEDKDIEKAKFAKIQEDLKSIDNEEVDDSNKDEAIMKLVSLRDDVKILRRRLKAIQDYETVYSDFLTLKDMDTTTKVAMEVVTVIRSIFDNFDSTKVFDLIAPTLAYQMPRLKTEIAEFGKHATALTTIESSLSIIDRLSASKPKKLITRGLPNGAMDLKTLSTDLKSSWFVNNLVKGRETESLQNFVLSISVTSSSLEIAQLQQSKFSTVQNIQKDFSDFVMKATELAGIEKKAENLLEAVVPCAHMMKKLSNLPNLENTEKVVNYVGIFVNLVKDFEKTAKEIRSMEDFTKFQNSLNELLTLIYPIFGKPALNQTVTIWEDIRKLKLLTRYDKMWETLQTFSENPFYLAEEDLPTSILTGAFKSAQDANIFEVVKCLPPTAPNIGEVIDFGKKTIELKAEKSKLTAVIPTLTSALTFSKSASNAINTLRSQRSQLLADFICRIPKDFNENVESFLMTGDLVNDLTEIEKNEKAIQMVSSPNDEVKQEVENIPGSDFYTDQYRKALTDSWNTVKNTIKSITAVKTYEDLVKSIGDLVPKIEKVVVKDLRKLKDPIATELFNNSDVQMKEAAKSFEIVSGLNLNFTSYSSGFALKKDFVETLSVLFPSKKSIGIMYTWVGLVIYMVGIVLIAVVVKLVICCLEKKIRDDAALERRREWEDRRRVCPKGYENELI